MYTAIHSPHQNSAFHLFIPNLIWVLENWTKVNAWEYAIMFIINEEKREKPFTAPNFQCKITVNAFCNIRRMNGKYAKIKWKKNIWEKRQWDEINILHDDKMTRWNIWHLFRFSTKKTRIECDQSDCLSFGCVTAFYILRKNKNKKSKKIKLNHEITK